jgi:hypothetical protein
MAYWVKTIRNVTFSVVYETLSTREREIERDNDGSAGIGYVLHSISNNERWAIAAKVNKLHYVHDSFRT